MKVDHKNFKYFLTTFLKCEIDKNCHDPSATFHGG